MTALATGVDLVEIGRWRRAVERHGQRLLTRIFSPQELAEYGHNMSSLAARFAAKEAVAKALGCGIGPVGWQEIEILRGPANRPLLQLHGRAERLAADLDLHTWSLSLSHTNSHAIALVVALGKG